MLCYAKSLQSCPTLSDPMDCSPPGSTYIWSIVDLQCSVNFRCTAKLISYTHNTVTLFRLFSHIGLYRVLLVINFLYSSVYMQFQSSRLSLPSVPHGNCKFIFYICDSISVFVVVQSLSHVWLFETMNCSMPGSPVLHYLPGFSQIPISLSHL